MLNKLVVAALSLGLPGLRMLLVTTRITYDTGRKVGEG